MKNIITFSAAISLFSLSGCYVAPAPGPGYYAPPPQPAAYYSPPPAYYPYGYYAAPTPAYVGFNIGGHGYWRHH